MPSHTDIIGGVDLMPIHFLSIESLLKRYGKQKCPSYRISEEHAWDVSEERWICKFCNLRIQFELIMDVLGGHTRPYIIYPEGISRYSHGNPSNLYQSGDHPKDRICLRCGSSYQGQLKNMELCRRTACHFAACNPKEYCCKHDPRKRKGIRILTANKSLEEWL